MKSLSELSALLLLSLLSKEVVLKNQYTNWVKAMGWIQYQ